jgi:hypothetical protein
MLPGRVDVLLRTFTSCPVIPNPRRERRTDQRPTQSQSCWSVFVTGTTDTVKHAIVRITSTLCLLDWTALNYLMYFNYTFKFCISFLSSYILHNFYCISSYKHLSLSTSPVTALTIPFPTPSMRFVQRNGLIQQGTVLSLRWTPPSDWG